MVNRPKTADFCDANSLVDAVQSIPSLRRLPLFTKIVIEFMIVVQGRVPNARH